MEQEQSNLLYKDYDDNKYMYFRDEEEYSESKQPEEDINKILEKIYHPQESNIFKNCIFFELPGEISEEYLDINKIPDNVNMNIYHNNSAEIVNNERAITNSSNPASTEESNLNINCININYTPQVNITPKNKENIFNLYLEKIKQRKKKQNKTNSKFKEQKNYSPSDRKLNEDGIRKKGKVKLHQWLNECLSFHIEDKYEIKGIKFSQVPQKYMTCISNEENFKWLNWTVSKIMTSDFGGRSKKNMIKNPNLINYLKQNHSESFSNDPYFNMKMKEAMQMYLNSKIYKCDLEGIKKNEGEKYAKEYDRVMRGNKEQKKYSYVEYFLNTPGNKRSKKRAIGLVTL
jgi:hypothetical protein